jgi:hypothetical protein
MLTENSRRAWIAVALATLSGCRPKASPFSTPRSESLKMKKKLEVRFGERGGDFAIRNPGLVKINKQPAGLNFYSIDCKQDDPGEVIIENGTNSLHIANVLGMLASEDADTMDIADSFQKVWIGAAVSHQELISHDQARLALYAWLQDATIAGWRPNLYDSDPRLSGKSRFDYATNQDNIIGLDNKYMPSLEEWMRLKDSTHWLLSANHVFLDLSFQRDDTRMDITKPGAYFLSFNFTTALEYFRSYAGADHRKDWKKFMPAARAEAFETRKKIEAELRAKGIPIDESYQDPIPPIQ